MKRSIIIFILLMKFVINVSRKAINENKDEESSDYTTQLLF